VGGKIIPVGITFKKRNQFSGLSHSSNGHFETRDAIFNFLFIVGGLKDLDNYPMGKIDRQIAKMIVK